MSPNDRMFIGARVHSKARDKELSAAAFCNVRKAIRMEAEIARLKQDLKVNREIRKVLKK